MTVTPDLYPADTTVLYPVVTEELYKLNGAYMLPSNFNLSLSPLLIDGFNPKPSLCLASGEYTSGVSINSSTSVSKDNIIFFGILDVAIRGP